MYFPQALIQNEDTEYDFILETSHIITTVEAQCQF